MRGCIAAASTETFRVCESNVTSNHVHLVCEAGSAGELARGMQRRLAWDPWSSAATFDGWAEALPRGEPWQSMVLGEPRATAPAGSWLLTTGWRRGGRVQLDEAPADQKRR